MTFLHLVVSDLLQRYPNGLSDISLVFPNRRAGLFFNKFLSESINKPMWAPNVVTINDTMLRISDLKMADPIAMVSDLYEVYCHITGSKESFDDFYFWGEVLLSDFDQIDKYQVDVQRLFANIKDLKDIEAQFDGFTDEQRKALSDYLGLMELESDLKNKYCNIWDKLSSIYNGFTHKLISKGLCYEGLAYRLAAKKLEGNNDEKLFEGPLAFIGFNALNNCEHTLLRHCKRNENTLFYWDYIPIFEGESTNEAYTFIHENLKLYPNALDVQLLFKSKETPAITIISASNQASQAKLLPKLLSLIQNENGLVNEKTAIILPQENLMIPVLKSLPEIESGVNVTIGYPLKETPAYGLAELLIRLQINTRVSNEDEIRFYHRDVIAILNHPYIRFCEPEASARLLKSIKENNQIYPTSSLLSKSLLLQSIFKKVSGAAHLNDYLIAVCSSVASYISSSEPNSNFSSTINLEFLFALFKSLNRLKTNITHFNFEIGPKVFFQILRKAFVQERVSFTGEPLSGLQIMGFLETRALDFENLIILSFNDDLLPGQASSTSFITPSLRVAFGLPNFKHHEAVYSYNFYRLLYRSKKVFLVYSNRTEGGKSGEMSRYGLQLQMEYMPNEVKRVDVGFNFSIIPTTSISVNKSEAVISDLIANLSKKGDGVILSPSGLITYINCPLKFYCRYGIRLYEADDISEEVNAMEFGKIIHSTIEELYKPFCGAQVQAHSLKKLLSNQKNIELKLNEAFAHHFLRTTQSPSMDSLTGRNMLIRNALLYMVNRIIAVDIDRAPFHLVNHEEKVSFKLNTDSVITGGKVSVEGTIDRLEGSASSYTVIDFKTGTANNKGKFKELDDLFSTEKIDKAKEVFQIFCYSLGVSENFDAKTVIPYVWFVRSIMPGEVPQIFQANSPIDNFIPFANEFKGKLSLLVNEIFNPNVPFSQTAHTENCKTCPYSGICNK